MSRPSKRKTVDTTSTLADAISDLEKSARTYQEVTYIRTGVLAFDDLFAGKGMPAGRIIEFSSREGVGKSTMMLQVVTKLCEQGYDAVYVDAEFALTDSLIEGTGALEYKGKGFYIARIQTYSMLSDFLDKALNSGPALIVIDSITALKPASLASQNVEDVQPGLISRLQATFFQKYKDLLSDRGTTLVVLNQMRTKLNFTGVSTEGPSGGNAMKFYADARFTIRRKQYLTRPGATDKKEDEINYGADCVFEPLKCKICHSRKVHFTVIYGQGLSNIAFMQSQLLERGYMRQSSSFFVFETKDLSNTVRGREAAMLYIKENYLYFVSLLGQESAAYEAVEETDNPAPEVEETKTQPSSRSTSNDSGGLKL